MTTRAKIHEDGGAVFGMLIVTGIVGILLIAHLSLIGQRAKAVARSQSWNLAVPVAEAGLEEAMAHLNHSRGRNMGTNGWVPTPPTSFIKTYDIGTGRYLVEISNASPPTVEITGAVQSRATVIVAAGGEQVTRSFRINTRFRPEVSGLIAQNKAMVAGNVRADSYDSTNPAYSSNGVYAVSKSRDNSFIGSISTFAQYLEVTGGALIYGSVGTGAAGGLKTPLPSPTVIGDALYISDPANGGTVQSGHYSTSLNVPVYAVPATPFTGGFTPSSGNWMGTNYAYLLTNGNYKVNGTLTLEGVGVAAKKMMVTGNAALWITDTFYVKQDGRIIIAPNARLTLYMQKQFYTMDWAQSNAGGRPDQFWYYGMNVNAEFYMSGQAKVTAVVYAPYAKVDISGGAQLSGAALCNELSLAGDAQFHYDESLSETKEQPFIITSWKEL